ACYATAECAAGLYCSTLLKCTSINAKPQAAGGACGTTADCERGLVCDIDATTLFTQGPFDLLSDDCKKMAQSGGAVPDACKLPKKCTTRGTTDAGSSCKVSGDCLAGLFCADVPAIDAGVMLSTTGKVCTGLPAPLQQEPPSIPIWDGVSCPPEASTATAYFEVPRTGKTPNDFYRLPFPNDIRKKGGKIDLSAHPVPATSLGVPIVERFVKAAGDSLTGFSTNPVAYFRFSEPFSADKEKSLTGRSLFIVNVTPGSPDYNTPASIEWGPSGIHSNYICDNWLAFRRPIGSPLHAGTTYAAIVTRAVTTKKDGSSFEPSSDFQAVLGASKPSDADLARAYDIYAPLRAWLADRKRFPIHAADPTSQLTPDMLLNAAVFTTQSPEDILPKLRSAVVNDHARKLSGTPIVCKTGVTPPDGCSDKISRICHPANSDYTEIFGKISLPIFQKGMAPYEKPEDGGEIAVNGSGDPVVQRRQDVCFALTVPSAAAPAAGYPVMVYAHGTGGSYADETGPGGLAKDLATPPTGKAPAVLLAIDMPEHGNRRGASTRPPEDLFFNFANPQGARGNVLQGSADLMGLAQFIAAGGIAASDSPTGAAIKFDASRVLFFGHSQGATHTAIMLPYEGIASAGVLSGVGGHLASSLLFKKKPVDIGAILPFVLFDPDSSGGLAGGGYNPALSIIQAFFDSGDPINYGHRVYKDPADSARTGHDLFMTYGLGDSFAPEKTQQAYALSASLTVVARLTEIQLTNAAPGLTGNETVGTTKRTVGMRQYDPMGKVDGHFVAEDTSDGRADVLRFIGQVMSGQPPQIGQ
ncbi:MAG TPA: hypothetical protein VF331_19010, partial [Polyangiales bacterium]